MKFNPFSIIIVFLVFVFCGIALIPKLSLQLNPSRNLSSLTISYHWPGANPRLVEKDITAKLEGVLSGISGIKDIKSESFTSGGAITLTIDKSALIEAIRFETAVCIRQIWSELPNGVFYPQITINKPDDENNKPLISYTLNAPASPLQIQKYVEDFLRPSLSLVKGIYKIDISGAQQMESIIELNPDKIAVNQVSTDDIVSAIDIWNGHEGIGVSYEKNVAGDISPTQIILKNNTFGAIDLTSIPVKKNINKIIYLRDIATIIRREAKTESVSRINGLSSISLTFYPQANLNNLNIAEELKTKLSELSTKFPASYKLIKDYDSTEYIREELQRIYIRTIAVILILLLFLFLFTRQWRYLFLIIISLTVSLSISVIFYYLFRIEIHLFSLAGITISTGLLLDDIIIMSDHYRRNRNIKVFPAVFGSSLTTIASLVIVFFLDEKARANLVDFAAVVVIGMSVSLITSLFFIPALMEIMPIQKSVSNSKFPSLKKYRNLFSKRKIIVFNRYYSKTLTGIQKRKIIALFILIFGFGIPVNLLPDKSEETNWSGNLYNSTLGSNIFTEDVKPILSKIFGGTLRLFSEYVFEGSFFGRNEETYLMITASTPNGTSFSQMEGLIRQIEGDLSGHKEIKYFQTQILSSRRASIFVYFHTQFQRGSFPSLLKNELISKSLELGGATWGVYGYGNAFNNEVHERSGQFVLRLYGYNYDELTNQALLVKQMLMQNKRMNEAELKPELSPFKVDDTEMIININNRKLANVGLNPFDIFRIFQTWTLSDLPVSRVNRGGINENINIHFSRNVRNDAWAFKNRPTDYSGNLVRLNNYCSITDQSAVPKICKENQQYRLFLQINYVGADKFAHKIIDSVLIKYKKIAPVGYTISSEDYQWYLDWNPKDKQKYWLLGLVAVIVFFLCSILFDSLKQPFAVIFVIPISYIGVFLTFYFFDLNFDQGGFAAFVLLSGITVNATIYIINEFNFLSKSEKIKKRTEIQIYIKAFNHKIIPVTMTFISNILGFLPFLIGEQKEIFWFALAAGTIGGLITALTGIIFYMPLFMNLKIKHQER